MNCRHCNSQLKHTFVDLGFAPPSNAYLTKDDLNKAEKYYPLKVKVCDECWLVQTVDFADAKELFHPEYAYLSSTSSTWLDHAKQFSKKIITNLGLDSSSQVIEIASNDGYLLKNFKNAKIPCLGIEPTERTAQVAESIGINVIKEFFGESLGKKLASENKQADLIIGNNVYAHIPDINDFTRGLKELLKPNGTVTLEFPYLLELIKKNQFDTIYHEHFSYLSLFTVKHIFSTVGLRIWNVEELSTHGGSIRIYGCHIEDPRKSHFSVKTLLEKEISYGLQRLSTYSQLQLRSNKKKNQLLKFLIEQKFNGKKVVGYGAAAKGNTLLNYAGVKPDILPVVFDSAKSKQGKFLPGSHIPILPPEKLVEFNPDIVLILPWNLNDEIMNQYKSKQNLGIKFTTFNSSGLLNYESYTN